MTLNLLVRKLIYPFILPNALVCLGLLYLFSRPELPEAMRPFLPVFPWVVLGGALFLGWRFNRSRLLWFAILLVGCNLLLHHLPEGDSGRFLLGAAATLLPVNFLLVSLFRERGMINPRSMLYGSALLAQVLTVAWLHHNDLPRALGFLDSPLLPSATLNALPQLSHLSFLGAIALLAWRYFRSPAAFEGSLLWAMPAVFLALQATVPEAATRSLSVAGLLLVLGVVESSHAMAYRDELTGLHGRRALNELLDRQGSRYALAMLDIDHFKKFNDTHGHDVGDQVLKMVAGKLAAVTGGGRTFRYGGEEFTVVFARKNTDEVIDHLEQLRESVAEARFYPRGNDRPKKRPKTIDKKQMAPAPLSVTISIGVSDRKTGGVKPEQILKSADEALYRAKKAGRNQVCT